MKSTMVNRHHSNHKTGNISRSIAHSVIDEETAYVINYFKEHNIPYHLENGIAIRDDESDTPEFINMTCKKCRKTHDMPYDIYMDMLEYDDSEYLEIECIYCNKGIMIPSKHIK